MRVMLRLRLLAPQGTAPELGMGEVPRSGAVIHTVWKQCLSSIHTSYNNQDLQSTNTRLKSPFCS